jgi:hypothetical protein
MPRAAPNPPRSAPTYALRMAYHFYPRRCMTKGFALLPALVRILFRSCLAPRIPCPPGGSEPTDTTLSCFPPAPHDVCGDQGLPGPSGVGLREERASEDGERKKGSGAFFCFFSPSTHAHTRICVCIYI